MQNNKTYYNLIKTNKRGIISKQTRANLYNTLEATSVSIEQLRRLSAALSEITQGHISMRLREMEDKIIYLYGKINDLFVASELAKIVQSAKEMIHSLETSTPSVIEKKVEQLEAHIALLGHNFCLSKREKLELSEATNAIKQAKGHLEGSEVTRPRFQTTIPFFDESEIDQLVMELWEAADLLYHGKTKEGLSQYRQLPESVQKIVQNHEHAAPAKIPDTRLIQALIATSQELADPELQVTYHPPKEIEKLFTELDVIRAV